MNPAKTDTVCLACSLKLHWGHPGRCLPTSNDSFLHPSKPQIPVVGGFMSHSENLPPKEECSRSSPTHSERPCDLPPNFRLVKVLLLSRDAHNAREREREKNSSFRSPTCACNSHIIAAHFFLRPCYESFPQVVKNKSVELQRIRRLVLLGFGGFKVSHH